MLLFKVADCVRNCCSAAGVQCSLLMHGGCHNVSCDTHSKHVPKVVGPHLLPVHWQGVISGLAASSGLSMPSCNTTTHQKAVKNAGFYPIQLCQVQVHQPKAGSNTRTRWHAASTAAALRTPNNAAHYSTLHARHCCAGTCSKQILQAPMLTLPAEMSKPTSKRAHDDIPCQQQLHGASQTLQHKTSNMMQFSFTEPPPAQSRSCRFQCSRCLLLLQSSPGKLRCCNAWHQRSQPDKPCRHGQQQMTLKPLAAVASQCPGMFPVLQACSPLSATAVCCAAETAACCAAAAVACCAAAPGSVTCSAEA